MDWTKLSDKNGILYENNLKLTDIFID